MWLGRRHTYHDTLTHTHSHRHAHFSHAAVAGLARRPTPALLPNAGPVCHGCGARGPSPRLGGRRARAGRYAPINPVFVRVPMIRNKPPPFPAPLATVTAFLRFAVLSPAIAVQVAKGDCLLEILRCCDPHELFRTPHSTCGSAPSSSASLLTHTPPPNTRAHNQKGANATTGWFWWE